MRSTEQPRHTDPSSTAIVLTGNVRIMIGASGSA